MTTKRGGRDIKIAFFEQVKSSLIGVRDSSVKSLEIDFSYVRGLIEGAFSADLLSSSEACLLEELNESARWEALIGGDDRYAVFSDRLLWDSKYRLDMQKVKP